MSFSLSPLTFLNSLSDILYVAPSAPAMLVFLEHARPTSSLDHSTCCLSIWNAPSPDSYRGSSLTTIRSNTQKPCFQWDLSWPSYPFQSPLGISVPYDLLYFFFLIHITLKIIYIWLIVSWLLSSTLKWKLHEERSILFILFIIIS